MTNADRAELTELATLLTRYLVDAQNIHLAMHTELTALRADLKRYQDTRLAMGFGYQARAVTPWIEHVAGVEWGVAILRETTLMAQTRLAELLRLAGMEQEP